MVLKTGKNIIFREDRLGGWIRIVSLIILFLVVSTGAVFSFYLGRFAEEEIKRDDEAALTAISRFLDDKFCEGKSIVRVLAGSPWILPALLSDDAEDTRRANSVLDRYHKELKTSVCYLMNKEGVTIASSNRDDDESFVGLSYGFRPYFKNAVEGGEGSYFALGVTSLKRGFYASSPVRDDKGDVAGVIVIKEDIDAVEDILKNYSNCFFVNCNGIIFLSGVRSLVLRSLWPIDPGSYEEIVASRQFGEGPFGNVFEKQVFGGERVLFDGKKYMVSRRDMYGGEWSIVLLSPVYRIMLYRSIGVVVTAFMSLLILGFLVIIGQREKSSRLIRRSEERFKQIALSSRDVFWETDKDGRYTYVSQAVKEVFGYSPEEVIGKKYYDFFSACDKREILPQAKKSIELEGFFANMPHRCFHKSGKDIILETTGFPFFDARGNLAGYRGVDRDVSERKYVEHKEKEFILAQAEAEKERAGEARKAYLELKTMHEKLLRSEKLAAMGKLAGMVAHELKTPLGTIKNLLYLFRKKLENIETDSVIKKYIAVMNKEVDAATKIIGDMLTLDKTRVPENLSEVNLNSALDMTIERVALPDNIHIERNIPVDLPGIYADEGQLVIVLSNLLRNSVQAMPCGGKIFIASREKQKKIIVMIRDTGEGIEKKNLDKIFDPLFSTKFGGTGLGLMVCQKIIASYNGTIEIESEFKKGTTVTLVFPVSPPLNARSENTGTDQ
ncbi:MAG: ATP-binding protein [Candidatus Omnitrophota bacterium]